jgi:hypothetical protein
MYLKYRSRLFLDNASAPTFFFDLMYSKVKSKLRSADMRWISPSRNAIGAHVE